MFGHDPYIKFDAANSLGSIAGDFKTRMGQRPALTKRMEEIKAIGRSGAKGLKHIDVLKEECINPAYAIRPVAMEATFNVLVAAKASAKQRWFIDHCVDELLNRPNSFESRVEIAKRLPELNLYSKEWPNLFAKFFRIKLTECATTRSSIGLVRKAVLIALTDIHLKKGPAAEDLYLKVIKPSISLRQSECVFAEAGRQAARLHYADAVLKMCAIISRIDLVLKFQHRIGTAQEMGLGHSAVALWKKLGGKNGKAACYTKSIIAALTEYANYRDGKNNDNGLWGPGGQRNEVKGLLKELGFDLPDYVRPQRAASASKVKKVAQPGIFDALVPVSVVPISQTT